ncbi:tripartite tricarboxylate transporter TctB family protein [Terrilactibacillus laevilacticus]|uniref:Tripartite tricarboxylate transporter TctB family protein n=1 Tax=Terrilactibacillus laevilacticus TaxID=1380157 RepID=A0ABW5PRH3_9BACI|nr:tripartite tricarboxylate transporter TctB family protein [Terrilactibacillus laevilacticus]
MTFKLFSEKKISGFIVILLGLLSLHEGKTLYPYSKNLLTGDHVFPGLIGILLVVFGLALFFERKTEEKKVDLPTGKTLLILVSSIVILFFYCLLILFTGYVVSTLITAACLIKLIGKYRWINSILIAGIVTCVFYLLFIVFLKIPFPSGFFTF